MTGSDPRRVGRSFERGRTCSLSLSPRAAPILFRGMESAVPHHESLPALYRAILDVVADLERRGRRSDAVRIRAAAAAAYSTAWDDSGRRRLAQLHLRAWRLVQGEDERPAGRSWRWRRHEPRLRTSSH